MAILKVGKGGKSLAAAIRYAAKDADKTERPELTSGINCSDERLRAIQDMRQTKALWGKNGGRQYKSYIQSFAKNEVTPEKANQLGKEWAEKAFGKNGYEAFVGTHINSKSGIIHNHIIVNSVNYLDGHKIQLAKGTLERLKNINDEVCREHGLSVIDRSKSAVQKRNRVQAYSNKKYMQLSDEGHWMRSAADALHRTLSYKPQTAKRFSYFMEKQGWDVNFRGQKHITLINKKNPQQKVRVDTLAKTFNKPMFTKTEITKGFSADKLRPVNKTNGTNTSNQNSKDNAGINAGIATKGELAANIASTLLKGVAGTGVKLVADMIKNLGKPAEKDEKELSAAEWESMKKSLPKQKKQQPQEEHGHNRMRGRT